MIPCRPVRRSAFTAMTLATAALGVWSPSVLAAAHDLRGERQQEVNAILQSDRPASVASDRVMCATGIRGEMAGALGKAFGAAELPNRVADLCLAALIRSARDGRFALAIRENRAPSALAFDRSFMAAYQKREAMPSDLPSVATLKPIAERCLANNEPDTGLCSAAGYALGARVAHGEVIQPG